MIYCIINIIGNIILFASVAFLLGKAVWQDYKSFAFWKWKRQMALKKWDEKAWKLLVEIYTKSSLLKIIYLIIASIILYYLFIIFLNLSDQLFVDIAGLEESELRNIAIAFFGTVSGIGALFGIYLAILRSETTERQTHTAEQGLITDRLTKATEGLGKKDGKDPVIEVRLGSLYALERIAKDSIRDHIQIMEILCAYIRTNSPLQGKTDESEPLREDIQAAITIIGRREGWTEGTKRIVNEHKQGYRIDLHNCDLHGIQLDRANLSRANFEKTNFSGAAFNNSNLSYVNLRKADMSHASLAFVKLIHARLNNATLIGIKALVGDFKNANFERANISDAELTGGNFTDANLYSANLQNIVIHDANFARTDFQFAKTDGLACHEGNFAGCRNLSQIQLEKMYCGYDVEIPTGLTKPSHWECEDLSYDEYWGNYEYWRDKE